MKNNDSLESIGLNHECVNNKEKSIIVVSNVHGILANKNLFTGKITHVTKCFNNNNEASKEHVYYEESEFVDIADEYVEATAEDIYTYRENYYLLDGSRPFLDMTVEEIKAYL